jgi:DNA-binding transcriptional regulator YiaG
MKLNQYLVSKGLSQSDFAKQCQVCQATVHKWIYGRSVPSGKRMMQIHSLTRGKVSIDDWVREYGQESEG